MATLHRSIAGIALALALALLTPACSGTGTDTVDSGPSTSTEATTAATAASSTTTTPTPTTAPASTSTPTTPATSSPPTTPATSSPPTPLGATMPDVVGLGLQEAQDRIQTTGVFYSRSFDCTGAGRQQVLDRNWVVVTQTPDPGAPIAEGDALLGVVKLNEPRTCV